LRIFPTLSEIGEYPGGLKVLRPLELAGRLADRTGRAEGGLTFLHQ